MEERPKDIHQVLGNLRRRIDELSRGDYSRGYINSLHGIEDDLYKFHPTEIREAVSQLLPKLYNIPQTAFLKVSDDPHEEINLLVDNGVEVDPMHYINTEGESRRDLMRREIGDYISFLEALLKPDEKLTTLKYLKLNRPGGRTKLEQFHITLIKEKFIENIEYKDFEALFSGEAQDTFSPIYWKTTNESEFSYFVKELYKRNFIKNNKAKNYVDWDVVQNCFMFKGSRINIEQVSHNTHNPANSDDIDSILDKL